MRFNPRKMGRNDPCPCGSGKKYKRCCLPSGIPYVEEFVKSSEGIEYTDAIKSSPKALSDIADNMMRNVINLIKNASVERDPSTRHFVERDYRKLFIKCMQDPEVFAEVIDTSPWSGSTREYTVELFKNSVFPGIREISRELNISLNDAIDGFVDSVEELPLPGQPGEFEQNRRNPMTPDGWVKAFAEIYTPDGIPVWKWELGELEDVIAPEIQTKEELRELLDNAIDIAVSSGVASPGDKLIITIGDDVEEIDL